MARRVFDDYIDDVPEAGWTSDDDGEAAFWDEFFFLEERGFTEGRSYTVTLEDELTGDKRVLKHVRLSGRGKRRVL